MRILRSGNTHAPAILDRTRSPHPPPPLTAPSADPQTHLPHDRALPAPSATTPRGAKGRQRPFRMVPRACVKHLQKEERCGGAPRWTPSAARRRLLNAKYLLSRFGCCHLQLLCFSELKPNLTQPVLPQWQRGYRVWTHSKLVAKTMFRAPSFRDVLYTSPFQK